MDNPTGSVFCAHGAGFVVSWDEVPDYMHMERTLQQEEQVLEEGPECPVPSGPRVSQTGRGYRVPDTNEKELEEIFARTYGAVPRERNRYTKSRQVEAPTGGARAKPRQEQEEYLLVDGYNIIFAWEDLKELAKANIDSARDKLMDIMCNYQGYKKNHLILVFDAYKVAGGPGEVLAYHNIHVVYTKEAETADQYIEKTVRKISREYHVTVATSDALEQIIIMGAGATRLSAAGLLEEVQQMQQEIRKNYLEKQTGGKNYLFDHLDEHLNDLMEDVRLGKKKLE